MKLEELELHDALLKTTTIDYSSKRVEVKLELYLKETDTVRNSILIIFDGVKSISQIACLERLEANAFAGNINYWLPEQDGTTYIYLTDGCIAIGAKKISFKEG